MAKLLIKETAINNQYFSCIEYSDEETSKLKTFGVDTYINKVLDKVYQPAAEKAFNITHKRATKIYEANIIKYKGLNLLEEDTVECYIENRSNFFQENLRTLFLQILATVPEENFDDCLNYIADLSYTTTIDFEFKDQSDIDVIAAVYVTVVSSFYVSEKVVDIYKNDPYIQEFNIEKNIYKYIENSDIKNNSAQISKENAEKVVKKMRSEYRKDTKVRVHQCIYEAGESGTTISEIVKKLLLSTSYKYNRDTIRTSIKDNIVTDIYTGGEKDSLAIIEKQEGKAYRYYNANIYFKNKGKN